MSTKNTRARHAKPLLATASPALTIASHPRPLACCASLRAAALSLTRRSIALSRRRGGRRLRGLRRRRPPGQGLRLGRGGAGGGGQGGPERQGRRGQGHRGGARGFVWRTHTHGHTHAHTHTQLRTITRTPDDKPSCPPEPLSLSLSLSLSLLAGSISFAAQEAAAAPLNLPSDVVRSAGGVKAVAAMLLLPDGRARVKAAATKQKGDAGESYNNSSLCAPARARPSRAPASTSSPPPRPRSPTANARAPSPAPRKSWCFFSSPRCCSSLLRRAFAAGSYGARTSAANASAAAQILGGPGPGEPSGFLAALLAPPSPPPLPLPLQAP